MEDQNFTRRIFLGTLAAALPAGAVMLPGESQAQDLARLDVNDPVAKALLYIEDAADVDTSSPLATLFEVGQDCTNCAQIQGAEGEAWRPCGIFPGKLVAAKGWCSVWVANP